MPFTGDSYTVAGIKVLSFPLDKQKSLVQLFELNERLEITSEELVNATKTVEKNTTSRYKVINIDLSKSEQRRSWRILRLNHGIIAASKHNLDIFSYPEHVRYIMETFYNLTNKATLH